MREDHAVATDAALLRVGEVSKSFGGNQVLANAGLTARRGEIVALLGPSGCGKTTMLRCIAGLETPDSGEILIADDVVFSSSSRRNVSPEARKIGFVFQSYAIWPHMTVRQNVEYGLRVSGIRRAERRKRVDEVLEVVGLSEFAESEPALLSGGQQQRVAVARSIVTEPRLLLLDEPFSNLDAGVRMQMRDYMRSLVKRLGITTIMVTHDSEEALVFADQICIVEEGKIVESGTPKELYNRPRRLRSARALGQSNVLPIESIRIEPGGAAVCEGAALGSGLRIASPTLEHGNAVIEEASDALQAGSAAHLMVRPERIRVSLGHPQENDINVLVGTVRQSHFIGRCFALVIHLQSGLDVRAESETDFLPGDEVTVHLPAEHLVPLLSEKVK